MTSLTPLFFWAFWMCLQVVRCCLEHAASVAKTFLTCDVVVVDIKEPEAMPTGGNQMDNSGRRQLWGGKKGGRYYDEECSRRRT